MEFIRIQSADNPYTDEFLELYFEAFPENQRHSEQAFKALLKNEDLFHCNAVTMNKKLVGFINYWDFEEFAFVEHVAIEPPLRGHKLGEKIISLTKESLSVPLVLEVEYAESSEWGSRRIEFYNRLGFEIVPSHYMQPPYRKGEKYVPLHLMSDDLPFAAGNFEKIKDAIYKIVYKVG